MYYREQYYYYVDTKAPGFIDRWIQEIVPISPQKGYPYRVSGTYVALSKYMIWQSVVKFSLAFLWDGLHSTTMVLCHLLWCAIKIYHKFRRTGIALLVNLPPSQSCNWLHIGIAVHLHQHSCRIEIFEDTNNHVIILPLIL